METNIERPSTNQKKKLDIKSFKNRNLTYKQRQRLVVAVCLGIPLLLLLVFTYLPVVNMFMYSFTKWNGFSPTKEFVGLENYITIFSNPDYFSVFKNSLYYFGSALVQIALALYFAVILSTEVKGKNFFKGALFFPYLINGVAISFIFMIFFRPDGTLDTVLRAFGLDVLITKWLGNPDVINYSLAGTSLWRYMGFNFIIFFGVIQSIPKDIYEAAAIDGASAWKKFIYIIIPNIKLVLEINVLLAVNGAISAFEIPYIMTGGGNGSMTFIIQTLETAFTHNKIGLASAMGIVLMCIVLVVTGIQRKFFGGED